MIRGIQRQMIMVKTDKSSIFESACFLLRTDIAEKETDREDMLKEANRIIDENYSHNNRKRCRRGKRIREGIPPFFLGSLCGSALFGLIWLICTLR